MKNKFYKNRINYLSLKIVFIFGCNGFEILRIIQHVLLVVQWILVLYIIPIFRVFLFLKLFLTFLVIIKIWITE